MYERMHFETVCSAGQSAFFYHIGKFALGRFLYSAYFKIKVISIVH